MMRRFFCLFLLCGLSACESLDSDGLRPYPDSNPHYKVGDPYQIKGVWYYPQENYGYDEVGVASWYGPGFHGRLTANGEVFDANELTAAHRTLPLPSLVRVTNLDNGRQIVLRVNDRGPYAKDRIIDISKRGAQLLGFQQQGTARVRVQIMAEESRSIAAMSVREGASLPPAALANPTAPTASSPPPDVPRPVSVEAYAPTRIDTPRKPDPQDESVESLPPSDQVFAEGAMTAPTSLTPSPRAVRPEIKKDNGLTAAPVASGSGRTAAGSLNITDNTGIFVQAGAFAKKNNAAALQARLKDFTEARISEVKTDAGLLYRVRIGPLASPDEADRLLLKLADHGVVGARILVD